MGTPVTGDGIATADIRVYRGSNGVLYITNKSSRSGKSAAALKPRSQLVLNSARNTRAKGGAKRQELLTNDPSPFGGRIIDVQKDLAERRGARQYVHDPRTTAPIHVYRNKHGTLLFTNVPNQPGYRPFLFLQPYVSRMTRKESADFDRLIRAACARYGVEFELVKAVIKAESAFNPLAISRAGARGLMQLMPATAADHGVADIHSPRQNIDGGVRHLRLLLERFAGNVTLALAAYNAGAGAVDKYNGIPPYQETQQYVRKVLRFREAYRERSVLVRPPA
jgi:soluble lytic murein transglycosylase